jgi:hypothetical protein
MTPLRSLLVLALISAPVAAFADGGAPAAGGAAPAAPAPKVASDEAAAAAIATFKEAWKAKGLKGEEKLMQRDFALSELAKVQHPLVVAELGDVAKSGDTDLKIFALVYLAEQKASPALAGQHALAAIQKNAKDTVIVLTGLQTLGSLKYLGAGEVLKDLLKSDDFAVRKYAISTVGKVGDMRLLDELLKILGVDPKAPPTTPKEEKSGGKEVVEEGYSWEGAEATVDHGHADNSQENAEAKAKAEAQIAANKAAAQAGKGGGGGGGGVDGGGGGGRGGSARSKDELKPYVLKALKSLTGETFMSSKEIRAWLGANGGKIEEAKRASADAEAAQKAAK